MFINFFITFHDDQLTGSVAGRSGHAPANPSSAYVLPFAQRLSNNAVLHAIASKFGVREQYIYNTRECTRSILVNISDETMFQIELMAHINEDSFCTYNLESKLFGFGSTKRQASNASMSRNSPQSGSSGSSVWYAPNNPQSQSFFDFSVMKHEEENLEYQVPEAFVPDLLTELKPYIVFEKIHMFQETVTNLHIDGHLVKDFITSYLDEEKRKEIKTVPTVPVEHIKKCFEFYIYDDPDILTIKDRNEHSFEFMRTICCEIMQLTNETF